MAQAGSMYKVGGRRYAMTPAAVLDKVLPRWRAKLPPRFSQEFIDGFVTRNRGALEGVVACAMMLRRVKRGASPGTPEAFVTYGRWGSLSLESVKAMLPADLVPESFGLINEYYTPTVIAESIAALLCPLLPELAGNNGIVHALEPSAGIRRLIRAFSPPRCLALEVGRQILKIAGPPINEKKDSTMKPETKAEPKSPTPEPTPTSKAEAEQDNELMGSFTSELDAVLGEDD
jgi:hypothetical protein